MKLQLHLTLLSDATFGRGDGVAGLVDQEVEHDAATGLPFLRGRTLRGLLVEECANIVAVLPDSVRARFDQAGERLFGTPGSSFGTEGCLMVSAAELPEKVREAVTTAVEAKQIHPTAVLDSLTAIRRQTAIDDQTGAPDEGSLRSMRVILRQTQFITNLEFISGEENEKDEDALALLAASTLALRRAGTGRNRGRGRLQAYLENEAYTAEKLAHFQKIVTGGAT
jgi:CRISPR/Cas system CSM-associated protein Csm3 (group 7 of RAMP superfamily)